MAPSPGKGDDFILLSPNLPSHKGDELFLRYGAHTNQFLFVEYGFVNPAPLSLDSSQENTYGSIDISADVEGLFCSLGSVGEQMRAALEEEGYWG
jgi:hypothetical protein